MASVIIAEIMLSLYPIVVKSIGSNIFTQVFVRALTYSVVSLFFTSMSIESVITQPSYMIISVINLVHIFSSYTAFKNMNAGVAMTIFYIYPLFNLIFSSYLTSSSQPVKTKINSDVVKYIMLSLLGVAFISFNEMMTDNTKNSYFLGLVAIIIAALTESLTYTFYKSESKLNPFDGIFTLYFFGTIAMLVFAPKFLEIAQPIDQNNIIKLVIFNLMIGLVGHIFRFYGISRTSTEIYSIYLFVGVISAYVFGWYFLDEKITIYHIIGTMLILFSVYQVNKYV